MCVRTLWLSHVLLFVTTWATFCQAPLSMGFPRQEYCSRLLFPTLQDLPDPGIEPVSPAFQEDALPLAPPGKYATCYSWFDLNLSRLVSGPDISIFVTNLLFLFT